LLMFFNRFQPASSTGVGERCRNLWAARKSFKECKTFIIVAVKLSI
jgi:hypothetical protein